MGLSNAAVGSLLFVGVPQPFEHPLFQRGSREEIGNNYQQIVNNYQWVTNLQQQERILTDFVTQLDN